VRITIDLSKQQIKALDSFAKAKGISRAAVVREAVATYLPEKKKEKKRDINYWRNHPAFGSEKMPKGFDSVEYVRKLRAEWDHRARMYDY
jgi:predicted transcriptional regulator